MTPVELNHRSIPDAFLHRVAESPDANAFAGPDAQGEPAWLTWAEVGAKAKAIAAGLHALGVRPEDRVAIIANTRVEWVLADLGIMLAGAATTTVYPTTEPEDAAFIVSDSGSKVVIAENDAQAGKLAGTPVTATIIIDGDGDNTLAALERRGQAVLDAQPDLIESIVEGIGPDQLATLIYTSGTTGRPKGVELLHGGWVWEGQTQAELGLLHPDDLQYLWLPLSHSFGKTLMCGIVEVGIPTYVDGRVDKLVENLPKIRPTLMCGGAAHLREGLQPGGHHGAGGRRRQAQDLQLGDRRRPEGRRRAPGRPRAGRPPQAAVRHRRPARLHQAPRPPRRPDPRHGVRLGAAVQGDRRVLPRRRPADPRGLRPDRVVRRLIRQPPRARRDSAPSACRSATCSASIDTDGEILLKGRPIMRGYHNLPEETAAAFTDDGWLRTGDIGEIDADGYLRITDRKKDLIKTSGGKYVAPSDIEGLFKSICPYISQVLVIGQARNFCTMLITLDPDSIVVWAAGGPLEGRSYAEIGAAPETDDMVAGYVKELNNRSTAGKRSRSSPCCRGICPSRTVN